MPGSRFNQLTEDAKQHVHELSVADVKQKLDRGAACQVVDVREDHEWAKGHVPGAIHLSKGVIERDIEKLVPDVQSELILYCGGGSRSALAAESLQKMGYTRVLSMQGGMRGWRDAGLPVDGDSE